VYLICIIIGYWVVRKPVKRLVDISTEYVDILELEANYDFRERGGELANKLDKVKDKPMPSELVKQFRAN
jgi:hypothetical protein